MSLRRLISSVKIVPESEDFRIRAGLAAVESFGVERTMSDPVLVNVAALALVMGDRPTIHEFAQDAYELIDNTDLWSIPGAPPPLLESAFVLCGKNGADIFLGTTELGFYPFPGGYGLLGSNPGGMAFSVWRPKWDEHDISVDFGAILMGDHKFLVEWARQAVRFLMVYAALLEVEKTPLLTESLARRTKNSARRREQKSDAKSWITRTISLTTRDVRVAAKEESGSVDYVDGKILASVKVSGYIMHQAYGPQWSFRRWIYIKAYETRKWIAPGPRKINVIR